MEKPINLRYLHFGPVIGGVSTDPNLCDELLKRGRETTKSHVPNLAGHLDKENIYPEKDKIWFIDNFKQYFIPYIKKLQNADDPNFFYAVPPVHRVWLATLWINFMKAGEYNPPHNHSGAYSFVLYLQVPKELAIEEREFKGNGTGPGCISFMYGEDQTGIRTGHGVRPTLYDLWIFPASLKHTVPPFKSNVERISVSGNFYITDELHKNKDLKSGEFFIK